MATKRRTLLVTLLIAVLGGVSWLLLRPDPEPIYQGKPLSYWLRGFDSGSTPSAQGKADEAMRQIGTNAIPTLLRMLKPTDSQFKLNLIQFAKKQNLINIKWRTAWTLHREALFGFRCLGPQGKTAVPALLEIYNERRSGQYYRDCVFFAQTFATMGPDASNAVPQLVQDTTDTKIYTRLYAVGALAGIHARPDLALPALVKSLSDPIDTIRAEAIAGLGAFGTNAQSAVPDLLKALADPSPAVRNNAASALQQIDPEAAAKAGVN